MHIMHVITRLLRAGSEENTMATCRYQVGMGHRVSLVHGCDFDPFWYENPVEGVDLFYLPEMVHAVRPLQDAQAFLRLRRLYLREQPDVIHTHQSKAGILGRLASRALPNAIVAHGIHIVPFEGVSAIKRSCFVLAERWAAKNTDVFMGVSDSVGQMYSQEGIARETAVHCVRSGMDLDRFKSGRKPDDWRELLNISSGENHPTVALMMAAFEPRKRHVAFLQAFAGVADLVPDLKLMLAGEGPCEREIKDAVVQLGLQDRVVFCGHRSDPEALLAMADVLVLASEKEGLPRVVIQALAAGVPVIVNDLPGLEEVIHSGHNGIITPAGQVDETLRQMARILVDRDALTQLRKGAVNTNLSEWALDRLGHKTTTLYQRYLPPMKLQEVAAE
jgi:glycosyltransferase involved in cell wall biosynthesis